MLNLLRRLFGPSGKIEAHGELEIPGRLVAADVAWLRDQRLH